MGTFDSKNRKPSRESVDRKSDYGHDSFNRDDSRSTRGGNDASSFVKDKRPRVSRTTRPSSDAPSEHGRERSSGHDTERKSYNPNFTKDNRRRDSAPASKPWSKDGERSGSAPSKPWQKRDDSSRDARPVRPWSKDGERSGSAPSKPWQKRDDSSRDARPARPWSKDGERSGSAPSKPWQKRDDSSHDARPARPWSKDGERSGSAPSKPWQKCDDSSRDARPARPWSKDSDSRPAFKKDGFKQGGYKKDGAKEYTKDNYPRFEPPRSTGSVRLNRYISNSGVCSRREADDLIAAGVVTVNGKVITELGSKVNPSDEIRFNGELLKGEKKVYILMNKPKGFVTTLDDPHADKTVMDIVKSLCSERVYPVGRLDKNSVGVLLITNDGELTRQLTHPSNNKRKIYQVNLDKAVTQSDMERIEAGIQLEDGLVFADEVNYVGESRKEIGIEIHSGRNRIVRRIFESLGYSVQKLDRVFFAGLTKKGLKRGAWRFLTPREVSMLKSGEYE